jgi:hypothetical protein
MEFERRKTFLHKHLPLFALTRIDAVKEPRTLSFAIFATLKSPRFRCKNAVVPAVADEKLIPARLTDPISLASARNIPEATFRSGGKSHRIASDAQLRELVRRSRMEVCRVRPRSCL